jgi:hypothetical protein
MCSPNGVMFLPSVTEVDGKQVLSIPNGAMPKLHLDVRYPVTQANVPACGKWVQRLEIAHSVNDLPRILGSEAQGN